MAVHRKPGAPRRRDDGSTVVPLAATGAGGDLGAAARIIADDARARASAWSRSIPPRISVSGDDRVVTISCDSGPAYPGETRARHPLFGNRDHWYPAPGEPFLRPAAYAKADPALARYAQKIDKMARAAGFGEGLA